MEGRREPSAFPKALREYILVSLLAQNLRTEVPRPVDSRDGNTLHSLRRRGISIATPYHSRGFSNQAARMPVAAYMCAHGRNRSNDIMMLNQYWPGHQNSPEPTILAYGNQITSREGDRVDEICDPTCIVHSYA
ncbi:hypothetical protein RRF57_002212 [Xylaria bambusicola]|uniref:Uncharacterized protein n=1 Tax=Xylaria bambusicola TaxID=326684 RepID=A0AAN7Z294_9PEZI